MSAVAPEVVILNDHASLTGGSSAVAIASALGLAARGVNVTYFSCVGPVDPRLAGAANLKTVCLDQEEIGRNPSRLAAFRDGLRNARALQVLRSVLASKTPGRTVVHAHSWTKALSPFALSAVVEMGFRLVVTLHDFFIACPSGGFYVHRTRELCDRKPLSGSCLRCNCDRRNYGHKLWRSARTLLQNGVLRIPEKAACCIAVSEFSLNVLRPHLPPGKLARVVRNPVDGPDLGPAPVAGNRDFLFIGRCEAEKGVALYAEAARETGLPATIVGDGSLLDAARRICPGIACTGWLEPGEIRVRLRGARAIVFPPLWFETLGLVVVEAAAAGVPAIVSDRCAAIDFVRPGMNGLRFAHGSVESLARQMRALAADGALAARLGRAAYDGYWRDPWTAERHTGELLGVYEEIGGFAGAAFVGGAA